MNRVAITGMGIWSCLGVTLDEVRDSLYKGKSGIVLDQARKEMGFRSGLTSLVPLPDLKKELARSLEMAIRRAGVSLKEIGYVNAHATSTHVGDANEAKALLKVLGEKTVPVTSTKSQTGHEMWMAGASEVIYSLLMMKNDFIAGNINFENPDEDSCHLDIPAVTREAHFDTFLSNSFGFGGTNSTLIIRNV